MENTPIIVNYKWSNDDKYGDLVCELTEFMDKYLLDRYINNKMNFAWRTYIYNDISVFTEPNEYYQIAFRVPGATRGGIRLKRINKNVFEILSIHFIDDTCFGSLGCYNKQIRQDIKAYIGRQLDFTNVCLMNNDRV